MNEPYYFLPSGCMCMCKIVGPKHLSGPAYMRQDAGHAATFFLLSRYCPSCLTCSKRTTSSTLRLCLFAYSACNSQIRNVARKARRMTKIIARMNLDSCSRPCTLSLAGISDPESFVAILMGRSWQGTEQCLLT
jgi:hypothetical protein